MDELQIAVRKAMDAACAVAWTTGFLAGSAYGRAAERFDPNRSHPDEEPSVPKNPYEERSDG